MTKLPTWPTPPHPHPMSLVLKLNSDAAVYDDGTAAFGFVVRDDTGDVLAAGAKREVAGGSSTLLEARALLHGLSISADCGLQIQLVETDSELLIRAINGKVEGEPYVMSVVRDIRSLASVWIEEIPPSCFASLLEDARHMPKL
ncbi:hypothetical protein ACS0TY_031110 [Phlomoides rotata]